MAFCNIKNSFYYNYLFYVYECFVCAPFFCAPGTQGDQKSVLDTLGPELQRIVGYCVVMGLQPWSSGRVVHVLTTEPPLQPLYH